MTRKNVLRIVFQNSGQKSVPVQWTKNAERSHGFAPVAMALYTEGSGIPALPMNRRCILPQREQGWRKGGGGVQYNKKLSLEYDYPLIYRKDHTRIHGMGHVCLSP
jgi:hypothetical protein